MIRLCTEYRGVSSGFQVGRMPALGRGRSLVTGWDRPEAAGRCNRNAAFCIVDGIN